MSTEGSPLAKEVDQFILAEIDSVPHLEGLLLLWNSRPRKWSLEEVAKALYLTLDETRYLLNDLKQRGFLKVESESYSYDQQYQRDNLIQEVAHTYRKELIRISRMIHLKASPSVREFARAFKFKKD